MSARGNSHSLRGLLQALALVGLTGCASTAPLDPITAASGGRLTEAASAIDVLSYELTLEVLPDKRSIRGESTARVRALAPTGTLQLALDERFDVGPVSIEGKTAEFVHSDGIVAVVPPRKLVEGDEISVTITYKGRPHVAERPPWDGGFVWDETPDGHPWIATAVQSVGCDLWWPCKDHFADKPATMDFHVTVPAGLSVALNGVLQSIDTLADGRRTFHWRLGVPAADYNVSLNIGPFIRIETTYDSVNGATVPIEFWALEENEEKARALIEDDLREQLAWFESKLGPYPWGDQKLGLVETPHLGMEHQTLNAYGNRYRRDPHGFDWLLQHELAHEWFGNLMTHERSNDAWLHEGYGEYMQPAYGLDRDGEASYLHQMYENYLRIDNCQPVVPEGDVTAEEAFTGDIYFKGAFFLHTLRWVMGDEAFWRATRRLLYDTAEPWDLQYPIEPVYRSTEDAERIVSEEAGRDLGWMFDVYLRRSELPVLVEERSGETLELSWRLPGAPPFPMPVPVRVNDALHLVEMPDGRGSLTVGDGHVIVDPEMTVLRRLPIIGTCEEIEAERASRSR